jgi:hypothetical protein
MPSRELKLFDFSIRLPMHNPQNNNTETVIVLIKSLIRVVILNPFLLIDVRQYNIFQNIFEGPLGWVAQAFYFKFLSAGPGWR